MKTVAVIPALNEHERLRLVIERTLRYVDQVVVVDDGSAEPLAQVLPSDSKLTVLRHIINLGKGAALKTGVTWALGHNYEIAVFLDADGQHDPDEIPSLMQPIRATNTDIVFGVRSFHAKMPLVSRIGNAVLTKCIQLLFRIQVSDTQSGYRAIRLSAFSKLSWTSARYAVETEMVVNTGKHGLPYTQVPISTIYHDKYKGTTVIDGIRILFDMLKWRVL